MFTLNAFCPCSTKNNTTCCTYNSCITVLTIYGLFLPITIIFCSKLPKFDGVKKEQVSFTYIKEGLNIEEIFTKIIKINLM